jgi:hypothetical protein
MSLTEFLIGSFVFKFFDFVNSNAIIGVLYSQSYQKKFEVSEKEINSKKV